MSCHDTPVGQDVRPGTARVVVTELSGSGPINPTPASKPAMDPDTEQDFYLSPDKLELLCGTQDLSQVTSLEMRVDTQENTLGNFGAYLPQLSQLKMNNSVIPSVRDLGTTLSNLQVLWISCCCLEDLDGILSLSSLRELYLAFNRVSDLSQIGMLENLQLLDLEGNDVNDLVQVQYLGLCSKLQTLTLEGNPVCVRPNPTASQMTHYSYRAAVRELVPQLRCLDDLSVGEDSLGCSSGIGEELAILRNAIRDPSQATTADEVTEDTARLPSRPTSVRCAASRIRPLSSAAPRPFTGPRPATATRPGVFSSSSSRPGSADSELAAMEADTSTLTHGAGKILFCGNPVQAIRARREKLKTAPTRPTFTSCDLPVHVPEHTYDLDLPDVATRGDVFADLRTWREQHSRFLKLIERERLPQVLAIHHSEEGEDDEEEGFVGMGTDSGDEEDSESDVEPGSPDSSFQSLSPEVLDRGPSIVEAACLSLSPDSALFPSPPLSAKAASASKRPQGLRAHQLRLKQATPGTLLHSSSKEHHRGPEEVTAHTDLAVQGIQQVTRNTESSDPHTPHPPKSSNMHKGLLNSCSVWAAEKYHTSKLRERRPITRPHTAKAALQKHSVSQPCRGRSHPA